MIREHKRPSLSEEGKRAFAASREIERDIEYKKKMFEFKRYILDSIDFQETDEILSVSIDWLKEQVILLKEKHYGSIDEFEDFVKDFVLFADRCRGKRCESIYEASSDKFKLWMTQNIFWMMLHRPTENLRHVIIRLFSLWV